MKSAILSQDTLRALSIISRFNDIVGNLNVLRSYHKVSNTEWDNCRNISTNAHLIQGVKVTSYKTDAIRGYVSKLAKLFMNSQGVNIAAWTKDSLADDNVYTVALVNRIGTKVFENNTALFKDVVVKVLGYDALLVDAALTDNNQERVEKILGYLATQYVDIPFVDDAIDMMGGVTDVLKDVDLLKERNTICTSAIDMILNTDCDDAFKALELSVRSGDQTVPKNWDSTTVDLSTPTEKELQDNVDRQTSEEAKANVNRGYTKDADTGRITFGAAKL